MSKNIKNTTALGQNAEGIACALLKKKGYHIVSRNDRTRFAELDIIACNRDYIVFIEVKYRKYHDYGGAISAITADKCRRLHNAAIMWLAEHTYGTEYENLQPRIDVVIIEGELTLPHELHIDHLEAITAD